jgi:hypothetical protein
MPQLNFQAFIVGPVIRRLGESATLRLSCWSLLAGFLLLACGKGTPVTVASLIPQCVGGSLISAVGTAKLTKAVPKVGIHAINTRWEAPKVADLGYLEDGLLNRLPLPIFHVLLSSYTVSLPPPRPAPAPPLPLTWHCGAPCGWRLRGWARLSCPRRGVRGPSEPRRRRLWRP